MTYTFIHTTKFILLALIITFSFFLILVERTEAYFTTNQTEIRLPDGTGLFLIEYSFGSKNHEVTMPIIARNTDEKSNSAVEFSIRNEDGTKANGKTSAIVLSSATVTKDGQYKIPEGFGKKFTLAVFFKPEKPESEKSYKLQVTHLPFVFDETQQLQLNPSELQYYVTKSLAL